MREDDSKWGDELPAPEDLIPLSQTLITPDLALAFDIHNPPRNSSAEFESQELGVGDELARILKRSRLVWTSQLHRRFVDAVAHLGIENAVPKTIMLWMSVEGLTRENVASHLQKYRLFLKRMHSTDHLFASSPVPSHLRHFGSRFEHRPFMRQSTQAQRIGTGVADDVEPANGRKMLSLFPNGGD